MSTKPTWDPEFGPSYTPEQMLRMGVFEGKYINAVKGVPAAWKSFPTVVGPNDPPDPKLNYYEIKARSSLSEWKKNGWIKTDKNGWFEWYINYSEGRRLGKEDDWQIGRWKSFVARHMGGLKAGCKLSDKNCHKKQRQALLQFGWDSTEVYTPERVKMNIKNLQSKLNFSLEELPPNYLKW